MVEKNIENIKDNRNLNNPKKIKQEKGSITLYVLISMMFFLVIISGIYFNTNNKMQKQEKEIEKIQKEYEKENINDIYEQTYNNYVNTETPTIQAYDGETLKSEVIGEKVSSRKTIYLSNKKVKLKFLSKNTSDKYAYSTEAYGEKIKIEGNTLDVDITTSGKTIYVYIVDNEGNYSKSYTAVTMILVTLQDKTIYVEEGKEIQIGEIQGENVGDITFGQVEDSTIIKLEGDKVTGLKAGTTTLIATESKAGATATVTVKVVKIELAETSGTMLIGDSKTVKITGTNNGTLSVKTSDEKIATVSLNNNEIIITAKTAGNATITVTENNVKAETRYDVKVASVTLTPNGGTYTMPTTGNATIKTTVTTENAEKIETAWSDNAGKWSVIENNKLVEKTDCTSGTYYLYVRINGEAIYKSKEFIVGENTLEANKITIKPSTTNWTNGNITATVTYGSTLTANKKAGYGTTLANAQTAASTSTATSLTATANGYFYAEATDIAGNKITASLQITTIDKALPTVTLSQNGGTYTMPTTGNATIKTTLTASDTGGSGLKTLQYAWSTSNTTEPTAWTTFTSGSAISKTDCTAGTYYLWTNVIDNAGNRATSIKTSNAYTVKANTDSTNKITIKPSTTAWTNGNITATITYGSTLTANKKAGYGTTLANAQTAASTSTATSLTATANGYFYAEATDIAGNKITASLQITNIDKALPTVTLSQNGGTYTMPTIGNATIKTTLTASDTGGSGLKTLQYAWATSNTTEPTAWTTFTSGSTISKTDCTAGTYYLWTNVIDNAGNRATSVKTSNAYTVKANTDSTSKITITPSTTAWTNGNITATVTYGSTLTANKKAGYGTTLANAQTAASTSTATSLTATANGYFYAEATDIAGNKITASLQITKIDKNLPTVTLSQNGGTYTIPTGGTTATIKTTLTASDTGGSGLKTLQYAWSTSNSAEPTAWTTFTSGSTISKTDCTAGTYYLWTKVIDNAGNRATSIKTSNAYTVKANTDSTSKITITPSTTNWTNGNVTATVTYGSTLTANKKAGYGTTLANAQTAASTSTATSLTATANGYFYAEATDIAGNKITASLQITKIDKALPTVTLSQNGGTYTIPTGGTTATIKTTLTASDTGGSGLKTLQYAWSTSNTTEPTAWTTFTSGSAISKTDCTAGTYYLWTNVIDNAGNRATSVKTSNAYTVKANTDATSKITIKPSTTAWTNGNVTATVTYGSTLTANKKAGYGTTLANAQTAASTSTATSLTATANGYFYAEATDIAGNKITASLQITNIDKALPTVTLSPNGGTYTIPTGGTTATIKTTLTASDTGGSGLKTLQYAWSTSNTTEPTAWTTFTSGSTISKTDCTAGTYYLWTNVIDNAGNRATSVKTSNAYTVKANTDATSKITITPSTTNWTNGNITATVTYGSTLTANKKAGYGTTLANAQTAASTSTATSLTATANGYFYAEATDIAGNKITASLQITKIDKNLPTVTLSPNGGTYTMPTTGNATIKTTLTASDTGGSGLKTLQYAWSTSNTTEPTAWTTFTSGSTISKTDCTAGTYYLWTKVIDNAGNRATSIKTSNAYTIKANTDATSKITIKPSTTAWTNGNVTATVTYGSTLTANKKAGYGTTLANAQTAASTSTATSLTATANGYFYAEATDIAGNKITASLQITNIDKALPTVTLSSNGGTYTMPTTGNATIKTTLTASDAGGSGLKTLQYAWSTSNTTEPTAWTTFTSESTISKTDCTAGTYYLWTNVIDNAGNRATSVKTSNAYTVKANTDSTSKITITPSTTNWTNGNVTATVTYGSTLTANKKAGYGTTLANAQTAASTSTATSLTATANGYFYAEATDIAGNKITASLQITKIDKNLPTVTLSQNGGTYTMPTTGNATIKTTLTASDTGGSGLKTLQYAWSTSNTAEPTSWTTFTSGSAISKTDCTAGTYYLWTNVIDNAGNRATSIKTSNAYTVKANTDTTSKITIKPSTTNWTNGNVTATVTYGSTLTANKKAGYGTTLANAQTAASTSTATSLTATANGYFYAEATDIAGNQITASLQITNIDKTAPTIGGISSAFSIVSGNTGTITISSIADTGGSGLSGYYVSTSSTIPTATSVTWTSSTASSFTYSVTTAGTYYVWVKDKAGNVSDAKSCTITTQTAIAKVENTYYSSITNAINAISTSGTITMCANTTESPTFPSGKTITWNLNSKTVTGQTNNNGTLTIDGNGTITANGTGEQYTLYNNGTINFKSGNVTSNYGWTVTNVGTFNMSGGIISNTATNSTGSTVMNKKTFNMSAGTINTSSAYGLVTRGSDAVSNVSGGTIKGNKYATVLTDGGGTTYLSNATIDNLNGNDAILLSNGNKIRIVDCTINGSVSKSGGNSIVEVVKTSTGYDVYYYDLKSTANTVQFPTWTNKNGQDDIIWYTGTIGTRNNSRVFYCNVKRVEHNNETGTYITHVYVDSTLVEYFNYTVN